MLKAISRTINVTTVEAEAVFKTEEGYKSRPLDKIKTGEKIDETGATKIYKPLLKEGETLVITGLKTEEKNYSMEVSKFIHYCEVENGNLK